MAMKPAISVEQKPTSTEERAPYTTLAYSSQPCLSKPNQCSLDGPLSESDRLHTASVSVGSMLLNRPGNPASSSISSTMLPALQNTQLPLRSRQASADRLAMADARIQHRVQQVHQ